MTEILTTGGTQVSPVAIKDRYLLTHPDSTKKTYHLVLDLSSTQITYNVGDCVAIYPENDPADVQEILSSLDATGLEKIIDREGNAHSLKDYLSLHANLGRVSKKLCAHLGIEVPQDLKNYHITDILKLGSTSPQELISFLAPMMPRYYSIASSMQHVGQEAHLTVGLTTYETISGPKPGLCTDYLCKRAPLQTPSVRLFYHKSKHFGLPSESCNKPIIMIGPGTGIAPFVGFMQERQDPRNWLFFGERCERTEFYYKDIWENYVKQGKLHLSTAFSRDQQEKVYVQDRMLKHADKLRSWLDQGAYLFICGDAACMAKGVHQALLEIIGPDATKELKTQGRYLRDVY